MKNLIYFKNLRLDKIAWIDALTGFLIYFITVAAFYNFRFSGVSFYYQDFFGGVFIVLHLLILRVLSRHPNFKLEHINFPEIASSSYLVCFAELRFLGTLAIVIQIFLLVVSLRKPGMGFLSSVALVYLWTFFNSVEFFKEKKNVFLNFAYSILQLMIFPWLVLFAALFFHEVTNSELKEPWKVVLLMLASLIVGFIFRSLFWKDSKKNSRCPP